MVDMEPVLAPLMSQICLALRDLIRVMGKDIIDTAAVEIEGFAEVLDADAFAEFKEHGIFDQETAGKFKKMLQSGGTVDPMELYKGFRGKEPTVDALLKRDGIEKN